MFKFLFGLVFGLVAGAWYAAKYLPEGDLQNQLADTQERLQTLLHEVRGVLDETRLELRQAWERTRGGATEATQVETVSTSPAEESGTAT